MRISQRNKDIQRKSSLKEKEGANKVLYPNKGRKNAAKGDGLKQKKNAQHTKLSTDDLNVSNVMNIMESYNDQVDATLKRIFKGMKKKGRIEEEVESTLTKRSTTHLKSLSYYSSKLLILKTKGRRRIEEEDETDKNVKKIGEAEEEKTKLLLESEEESTMALELIRFIKKNKELSIPEQTATGKGTSNPLMAAEKARLLLKKDREYKIKKS
ncbi:hypothetical protein Tco_1533793 [Tanacetum coccineum]